MWFHFWCCSPYVQYFYMKLVQYNKCLVSIVLLMAWCFSTRASVATMLTTHPCVSRCIRVNWYFSCLNSLSPVKLGSNFKSIIFKLIIQDSYLGTCCETVLMWIPQKLTNKKFTLVQARALCRRQTTSPYLSQCHHVASLGHSEFKCMFMISQKFQWDAFPGILLIICHAALVQVWCTITRTNINQVL